MPKPVPRLLCLMREEWNRRLLPCPVSRETMRDARRTLDRSNSMRRTRLRSSKSMTICTPMSSTAVEPSASRVRRDRKNILRSVRTARYVAYVRANNLHVSNVTTGRETALTTDGTSKILNGRLDWVYEEEIYGRGENRAYWWSPDSTRIAFLRLDDTRAPSFAVVDHIPHEQDVEQWDYPKAGDPNPIVKLGVASVTGGAPLWVDASKYPAANHLIVRVGWTPDSQRVVYEAQNRTQSWIDLNYGECLDRKDGHSFRETSKFWIGADDAALPLWRQGWIVSLD